MKHIIKLFFNSSLIFLILFFLIIAYTENTTTFHKSISNTIVDELKDNFNVNAKIESVDIEWNGFSPSIFIKNIQLNDKENKTLLKTPISEIRINIFKSIYTKDISINEVIINNTSITLVHKKSKLFMNNLDLIHSSDVKNKNTSYPKLILNNSKITIHDKSSNKSTSFRIKNFKANYNNGLKIDAKFFHDSSPEPITIIYRGTYNSNNLTSRIYIRGNSVKLPYKLLPSTFRQIAVDHLSMRIWIDLDNTVIRKISGNISSHNLNVNLPKLELKLKNVNGNILYTSNQISDTLSLVRLNYEIDNQKINNNKIVINKKKSKEIQFFIKKGDHQILKYFSQQVNLSTGDDPVILNNTYINNIQVNMSSSGLPEYYSFSIKSPSLNLYEKYHLSDVSMDIYGDTGKGKIRVNNLSLDLKEDNIVKNLKGSFTYKIKGKSIYFSSSNLLDEQGSVFTISGKKTSQLPSLKLSVTSTLQKIKDSLYPIHKKKLPDFNGKITSNIYFYNNTLFADTRIQNLYVKQSDSLYFSSEDINLSSTSMLIHTDSFDLGINDTLQKSKLTTLVNPNSARYKLTSVGKIDSQLIGDIFQINTDAFDGESLTKSNIIYDLKKDQHKLTLFLSTDMSGITVNVSDFISKTAEEKIDLSLKYQHYPTASYPLKISLNKNEINIKYDEDDIYFKISSPSARGLIKTPRLLDDNFNINGSFEFIDTKIFDKKKSLTSLPNINVKSRHLKMNGVIFDNVHIMLTQNDGHIIINKLNFKNPHLEMESSGKWYIGKEQSTLLTAKIESDNFGLALKTLGYPNLIRGGALVANINGKWKGDLPDFAFSALDGKLDFKVKDGQINQLDKGTQAIGQVLGLFSIASIPKRLSLDFSDFFSKGLSFDNLNADVTLNSGIADTKKMVIIGSFGEMRLTGESDLINKTHDQVLIFIPDLSSTSLVTGAVLGGPIGAAASIFYDKLLKEFGVDTNKLAGIEYSITGPWMDPKIKVTQSFKPIIN